MQPSSHNCPTEIRDSFVKCGNTYTFVPSVIFAVYVLFANMEFLHFFHITLAEAMGEKLEVELDKIIFNLSTLVLKSCNSPISPVLHSLLGRQPLLLPPFLSLKFAESMCPGFLLGQNFPQ